MIGWINYDIVFRYVEKLQQNKKKKKKLVKLQPVTVQNVLLIDKFVFIQFCVISTEEEFIAHDF